MIATALVTMALGWDGTYSRLDGLILFALFVAIPTSLLGRAALLQARRRCRDRPANVPQSGREALLDAVIAIGAMVLTVAGAQLVLNVTEMVVQRTGIGGSLIGVVTLGVASLCRS
jgi:cation:H+ antiporter